MGRGSQIGLNQENAPNIYDNLKTCLSLLGSNVGSLAQRADVSAEKIDAMAKGVILKKDEFTAIAEEIGISERILMDVHGNTEEDREIRLRQAFKFSGIELPEESSEEVNGKVVPEQAGATTPASSEDESGSAEPSISEAEPVWSDNDCTLTLGDKSFDIKSKIFRRNFISHVRSAKDMSFGDLGAKMDPKKAGGWFSSVDRGQSRIYREQIEQLAKLCDVSVGILVTGHGLRHVPKAGSKDSDPILNSERAEYFRTRVLNNNTVLADGVAVGELLELARDQEGTDWEEVFLTKTKRGVELNNFIEHFMSKMNGFAPEVQALVMGRVRENFDL